jgi:hypothetical protein
MRERKDKMVGLYTFLQKDRLGPTLAPSFFLFFKEDENSWSPNNALLRQV